MDEVESLRESWSKSSLNERQVQNIEDCHWPVLVGQRIGVGGGGLPEIVDAD